MGDCAPSPSHSGTFAERMGWTWPPNIKFVNVLAGARDNNRASLSMLYHRFRPVVYRYILARVADVDIADDLTSETFMAMIRGIHATRAEDELGFAGWLIGIARNHVLMHFRQQKVHPEVGLQPHWGSDSQSVAEEDDPLLVLMARETWDETLTALYQLTPEQQQVVMLRCVLGYPTDEVATKMGKNTGTIRALQFRALASLSRLLSSNANAHTNGAADKSQRRRNHAG